MMEGPNRRMYMTALFLNPLHLGSNLFARKNVNPLATMISIPSMPARAGSAPDANLRATLPLYEVSGAYLGELLVHEMNANRAQDIFGRLATGEEIMEEFRIQYINYVRQVPPFDRFLDSPTPLEYWKKISQHYETQIVAFLAIKLYLVVPNSMAKEQTVSNFTKLNAPNRGQQKASTLVQMTQIWQHAQREENQGGCPIAPTVCFRDMSDLIKSSGKVPVNLRGTSIPRQVEVARTTVGSNLDFVVHDFASDTWDQDSGFNKIIEPVEGGATDAFKVEANGINLGEPLLLDLLSDEPVPGVNMASSGSAKKRSPPVVSGAEGSRKKECIAQSKIFLSSSNGSEPSKRIKIWGKDDDSSDGTSVGSSIHAVPKLEAYLYYFGIRGRRHLGPKLIYRTSKDVFTSPSGPEQDARIMRLLPVYTHNKLSQDNLWGTIRNEVVKLLDMREIQLTSVDLVRFRWEKQKADGHSEMVISPVTIWIGVVPDSLNGDVAFESSTDILQLLEKHTIHDIEVAYRESETKLLVGPELFAPVDDLNPLKDVIDPVTTALSLPIAGLNTPQVQGTLGFYFRAGESLYGVTARHVLFPEAQGNDPYTYNSSGPKREVVLMGNGAFVHFLASIKARIGTLNNTITFLGKRIVTYTKQAEAGDAQAASKLAATQSDMDQKIATIEDLKMFFVKMRKEWSELNNRVIGYVVWAPPISVHTPPHNYTKDVCVIKLDERKLLPNFKGNVVDLGPEIEPGTFMSRMYPRDDAQSEFDYPGNRLFELTDILSAAKIRKPSSQDQNGDPVRYVIKRGSTTLTTIGCMNGFESHQRRYSPFGNIESVEAAIYPYDNDSGPFSRSGDSGALIVGSLAELGALLTSGTGPTNSTDITYGTPMHWLWDEVIKLQFPEANLHFVITDN
ncbi:unnamed protein product [Rhizoctonia solani]|uniref:Uncharacterized protein n=1 Tax=Rhizoctonia solani TaxID=456999 RepID=A0A8H3D386_9AGAM|nr:unnamed protein product [Rhizoctonia solani]